MLNIETKYKMKSGYEIPVLGLGVYQTPSAEAESLVLHAFKTGYRHVDSAAVYRNEAPCGAAIAASALPRASLFFTSKIPTRAMGHAAAAAQIDETLRVTGLSYVDLYLLHAPYGGRGARLGAWRALAEGVRAGKIRSIGVSNYGVHHLRELEAHIAEVDEREGEGAGGVLSVNQVELHPWLARRDIVQWCEERGVVVEAYSPLVRATRLDDPLLRPLVEKYRKTPAQILLRWSLQKGFITLPKSVRNSRIEENADIFDFEISPADMKGLETDDYSPCTWDPTVSRD